MPVQVRCPNGECRQIANVPETALGKSAKCRACGTTFVLKPFEEAAAEISLSMLKDGPPEAPKPAPSPTPVVSTPRIGETIGRFEVRKELGSGAFGTVYLAFDPQLQREVALKVPKRSALTNQRRVERFLREARAAAKLRHPNIVPVYDAGQVGEQLYIASAYVRGDSLGEIIDDGGIEFKRATQLVRQLAEGLSYAHREGIVHRDVKPANVMLDEEGQPLLMDFGLAAEVDSVEDFQLPEQESDERASKHADSRLTRAGSIMGTPSYMAPEIARGQRGEAQPASDQYALGVVLYELLTGRTPFEGPAAAVLHQVIKEQPPKPSEFRQDLPKDLETICLKAMAKDPRDRYVTCQLLADDLRRWQEGEPILARRQGTIERAVRWVKKEPKLAFMSGGLGLALLAIAGLLAVMWSAEVTKRDAARDAQLAAERVTEEARGQYDAEKNSHDATRSDNMFAMAREKQDAGDPLASWDFLNGVPENRRGIGWQLAFAQVQGFPEFRRLIHAPPTNALTFLSNNTQFQQITSDGSVLEYDVWTGQVVRRLALSKPGQPGGMIQSAAFSADGKRMATKRLANGGFGLPVPVVDGGIVAFPGRKIDGKQPDPPKEEIVVWDNTGKEIRSFPATPGNMLLALNAGGSQLAYAGYVKGAYTLTIWDVATGDPLPEMAKTLCAVDGPMGAMTFSPDGKLFAATTILAGGELRVWDIATGTEQFMSDDRAGGITHLAFSPDSARLAAAGGGKLEGPVLEYTVCFPVTQKATRRVVREGKAVDEAYDITVTQEKKEKRMGYQIAGMRVISKPVCVQESRVRREKVPREQDETYTTYEDYKETVTKDGKTETVIKKVPVMKIRKVTVFEERAVPYTVTHTKQVSMMMPDIDPMVRVWQMDGGNLLSKWNSGQVTALAWRQDGQCLATANGRDDACASSESECMSYGDLSGDRGDVKLWDPANGKLLIGLPCSTVKSTIAFSPDGLHIVAGCNCHPSAITVWSTQSRLLLANQRGDGPFTSLLFAQDNNTLSSHSLCDNTVRLWDTNARRLNARLTGAGQFMQFLPNGRFLATHRDVSKFGVVAYGGYGGYGHAAPTGVGPLDRWQARDGAVEAHPGDRKEVHAYSEDGTRFVTAEAAQGQKISVRDGQTGEQVCELAGSFGYGNSKIAMSRDGSRIAANNMQGAALWDGATGKLLAQQSPALNMDLSPDGKRWVVVTNPNFGREMPVGMPIPAPLPPSSQEPKKLPEPEKKIGAVADDFFVLFAQKVDPVPTPKVDPKAMKKGGPVPAKQALPMPKPALTIYDGDGKELKRIEFENEFFMDVQFDPAGKTVVATNGEHVHKIWNVESGRLIGQYRSSDPEKLFSPDGRYLAIHRPQFVRSPFMAPQAPKIMPAPQIGRLNYERNLELIAFQEPPKGPAETTPKAGPPPLGGVAGPPPVVSLEPPFSPREPGPNGKKELIVTVIDLANGQVAWESQVMGTGHGKMTFSADSKRLALGYVEGKTGHVIVWDATPLPGGMTHRHQHFAKFSGHFGAVRAVAFSPDGKKLASGGDDRTIKVWDLTAPGLGGGGEAPQPQMLAAVPAAR